MTRPGSDHRFSHTQGGRLSRRQSMRCTLPVYHLPRHWVCSDNDITAVSHYRDKCKCLYWCLVPSAVLELWFVSWLVACLTYQQHASVSQGRICADKFTCCHTETEAADQTFPLTQSQYTDTGPTSPSIDPITPGAWQGSHWSANFEVTGMTRPRKNPVASGIGTRDLPLSRRSP